MIKLMYQSETVAMPRENKVEQDIINLLDEYLQLLIKLLRQEKRAMADLQDINESIDQSLSEVGMSANTENKIMDDRLRLTVIALCIANDMSEKFYGTKDHMHKFLLDSFLFNEVDKDSRAKLVDISRDLLRNKKFSEIFINPINIKLFNLIHFIELPMALLDLLCSEELFSSSKWQRNRKQSDTNAPLDERTMYLAEIERYFGHKVTYLAELVGLHYLCFDSSKDNINVNGEIYDNDIALIIDKDEFKKPSTGNSMKNMYHKIIDFYFTGEHVCKELQKSNSISERFSFIPPQPDYVRKHISHKGSIIGLYGAFYAQYYKQTTELCLEDAIAKAHNLIKGYGFTCSTWTIKRVRKENLSIFTGES